MLYGRENFLILCYSIKIKFKLIGFCCPIVWKWYKRFNWCAHNKSECPKNEQFQTEIQWCREKWENKRSQRLLYFAAHSTHRNCIKRHHPQINSTTFWVFISINWNERYRHNNSNNIVVLIYWHEIMTFDINYL